MVRSTFNSTPARLMSNPPAAAASFKISSVMLLTAVATLFAYLF